MNSNQIISVTDFSDFEEYLRNVCHYLKKFSNTWQDECERLAQEALAEIKNKGIFTQEYPVILDQLAYQRWHHGDSDGALKLLDSSDDFRKRENNYTDFTWGVMTRSMILWNRGAYRESLEAVHAGMEKVRFMGDSIRSGILNWVLGVIYFDMLEFDRSIQNYNETLKHCESDEYMEFNTYAYACIGLGCALKAKGEFSEALLCFFKALNKSRENELWMEESRALYELGMLEFELGKFPNAEVYLHDSLKLRQARSNDFSSISNLLALGEIQLKLNSIDKAYDYFEKSLLIAERIGSKPKLVQIHMALSQYYKQAGNYENAFKHLEKSAKISKEINSFDLDKRFDEIRNFSF